MKKIPLKYQIFDREVLIDDKDAERLSPHLAGWNRLNEIFLLGINEPDLRRLVVLELMGSRRLHIINRLLGRLAKTQRQKIDSKIERILEVQPE